MNTKEKILCGVKQGLKVCGGCEHLEGINKREGKCVNPQGYPGPRDIAHMAPNSRGCFSRVPLETLVARLEQAFPPEERSDTESGTRD